MRHLNQKQIKLLDKWFKENYTGVGSIATIAELPLEVMNELEEIHDFETIWHHTDNRISDLAGMHVHWIGDFEGQTMMEQEISRAKKK